MAMIPPRQRLAVRVYFVLTFIVFTTVSPYIASFNNPNENVRVYMTMAIVDFHTFRIDKVLERHGYVNDMAKAPDPANPAESHLYSIKAPAMGYLGVPVYWAFTKIAPLFGHPVPSATSPPKEKLWWFGATVFALRFFVVQLPCFFFLVFYERFLRAVSLDTTLRLVVVTAVALGTNYLGYSLMFVSHTFFGITAFASFALITREKWLARGDRKRRPRAGIAFLAGLLAGLATLGEYQAFPVSCVLAIYAFTIFYRPTRLLAFLAGAGIDAGALMFYQWRCFDNPLTPGHKMAENPVFASWHKEGFFGLGAPSWETFRDLSFSHGYGFFGTSPVMWLGLLAIPFGLFWVRGAARARSLRRWSTFTWIVAMLALWIPISCAVNWRGGWTLGPRFFGAAPPFFGYGMLGALEHLAGGTADPPLHAPTARTKRRALWRGLAGGLALASVLQMGFVGLLFNTFPESVTRPLAQLALPLAEDGFVPHHAGELVGLDGVTFWYVVAALLFVAAGLAVFWPLYDRVATYALRVVVVAAFAVIGVLPAFGAPAPDEGGDGSGDLRFFSTQWEPPGRDRVAVLREEAERYGRRGPCLWHRLADLERRVHWEYEAAHDEAKGSDASRESCGLPPLAAQ